MDGRLGSVTNPAVIVFSGKICSGKTTAADGLTQLDHRYQRWSMAAFLKERVHLLAGAQPDEETYPLFRRAYQDVSALCRRTRGADYWARTALAMAQEELATHLVFDDVRYENEIMALNRVAADLVLVRLSVTPAVQKARYWERNSLHLEEEVRMHESETSLDFFGGWDLVLNTLYLSPAEIMNRVLVYLAQRQFDFDSRISPIAA